MKAWAIVFEDVFKRFVVINHKFSRAGVKKDTNSNVNQGF